MAAYARLRQPFYVTAPGCALPLHIYRVQERAVCLPVHAHLIAHL